ncbi:MAG: DUF4190 domain-containing protein [Sporichthyaceae bacterium]
MSEAGAQYSKADGPAGPEQQGWGPPQGYPPAGYGPGWYQSPRNSGQSIAVLALGVASLTVFWGVAGIVALFLAPGAKREIASSQGRLGGEGMIRAGVICSWVSIVLTVLAILAFAALFTVFATSGDVFINETISTTTEDLVVPAR